MTISKAPVRQVRPFVLRHNCQDASIRRIQNPPRIVDSRAVRFKQIGRASFANMVASVYNKEASVEARWSAQGLLLWKPARK
ncbi:hypothetical protein [Roseateles sp. MS654]|uniref:hypothetical protein n=1 Tax=Roseateles sp. MS654 TaxID=3412685 RepID=UPI003C2F7D5A